MCTLLSGETRRVTFAPRSEMPRPALANSRAVPDHSRASCRNRTCKFSYPVAELQLVETRIRAALFEKLRVRSLLHDLAAIEEDYLVGVRDRRKSMGDHEHRSALQQTVDRFL